MILNDMQVRHFAERGMIAPFVSEQVKRRSIITDDDLKTVSYGLSSFGYDLRLAEDLQMFPRTHHSEDHNVLDPKRFKDTLIDGLDLKYGLPGEVYFLLPPFASALGHSVETLHLPDDVFALCVGKSTYARCGLIVNTTPLEPGWKGQLVIEIHNTTPLPIRVYANEGIAQLVFFKGDRPAITYGDRDGKYQGQTGITTARV